MSCRLSVGGKHRRLGSIGTAFVSGCCVQNWKPNAAVTPPTQLREDEERKLLSARAENNLDERRKGTCEHDVSRSWSHSAISISSCRIDLSQHFSWVQTAHVCAERLPIEDKFTHQLACARTILDAPARMPGGNIDSFGVGETN